MNFVRSVHDMCIKNSVPIVGILLSKFEASHSLYQVSRTWNYNGEKCLDLLKGSSDFLSKIYYLARRKVCWTLSPHSSPTKELTPLYV